MVFFFSQRPDQKKRGTQGFLHSPKVRSAQEDAKPFTVRWAFVLFIEPSVEKLLDTGN